MGAGEGGMAALVSTYERARRARQETEAALQRVMPDVEDLEIWHQGERFPDPN